jgi:hypothetical protein
MPTLQDQIQNRIKTDFADAVFVPSDFLDITDRTTIKVVLARLAAQGKIRRLLRGVYVVPRYSEFLGDYVDPNPDEVVQAIARSNRWDVVPSGQAALNARGLSTQVPAVYDYVSSGPYKEYEYKGYTIRLSHRAQRDFFDDPNLRRTMLIIQALKALGKDGIDADAMDTLDHRLTDTDVRNLYDNTKYGTSWVFEVAKTLYERRFNGQGGKASQKRALPAL